MSPKKIDHAPDNGVRIQSIGPVVDVTLPCPEGGGLVVLRGSNGCGKSEALEAVSAVLGNKAAKSDLRPNDAMESGRADGFGLTLKVGRSNRTSGELEVFSLTDRLDLSDLIDPGLKGAAENDAKRIKALIRVTEAKADISLFADLLEQDGMALVPKDVAEQTDLVTMAAGVKSLADSEALKAERARDAAKQRAEVAKGAAAGIEVENVESDEATLQERYRVAVERHASLSTTRKAFRDAIDNLQSARLSLEASKEDYTGPSPEECELRIASTETSLQQKREELAANAKTIAALQQQLKEAQAEGRTLDKQRESLEGELQLNQEALAAATTHVRTLSQWQDTINAALPTDVTEAELQEAATLEAQAHTAVLHGQRVRDAKARLLEAQKHLDEAKTWDSLAEHWRDIGQGVDGVLSKVIKTLNTPIFVARDDSGKMRLSIHHAERGRTVYFAELSVGEKWAIALPIAARTLGENGVFVLPQEGFEGLDPDNRQKLVQLLRDNRVVCYTAEPARGDLTVQSITDPAVFGE